MKKYVYSFNEGSKDMEKLLGGKGANLAEMTKIGLPVPFGFTITTEACQHFRQEGQKMDEEIAAQIHEKIEELENVTGKTFGCAENPLLVSVRCGADSSMPGFMDTILNLGLNDDTAVSLEKMTGCGRFAYDSYRRFIQMYAELVLQIPRGEFAKAVLQQKEKAGVTLESDFSADDLRKLVKRNKQIVREFSGQEFPQDPAGQLIEAVQAVFRFWQSERAGMFKRMNGISDHEGIAVSIQAMVFGNMGETSGTGVAFSRNPSTGKNELYGEFLSNAQGDEITTGGRKPQSIDCMANDFPEIYKSFEQIAGVLEKHFKDMQEMEFTIENGRLYMLQTRTARRTMASSMKIAVDMVEEGLISKASAIERIDPFQIDQLLHPAFDEETEENAKVIAEGLPASPGAASGRICFTASDAERFALTGVKVILVRQELYPEELGGMLAAEGILTVRGGMTSHAAVVARGIGKCCVTGCQECSVDEEAKILTIGTKAYGEGDFISLNGSRGLVYEGKIKTVISEVSEEFDIVMSWADEIRSLRIRANADNPADAAAALYFGAEGIGLCRTEHMFLQNDRVPQIRKMILAENEEQRREAMESLMPFQKSDFKQIYRVMEDKPVTIRLIDPPLQEFIPQEEREQIEVAEYLGVDRKKIQQMAKEFHEVNSILGHRGCRLMITYPEIVRMQTRALMEAAIEVSQEKGIDITCEIMVPLIGHENELKEVKKIVIETAEECKKEHQSNIEYLIGTMIEVPRAALIAENLAKDADFFSFGTNDLTQTTFGLSRDDTGNLIKEYIEKGILTEDPFRTLDQKGVGALMEMAANRGKHARSNLKLGICGEHGGDPKSIEFCHKIGLHYVSCSPFRVPIARISAAQAAIHSKRDAEI